VLFLTGSSCELLDDLEAQEELGHFLQKQFIDEAIVVELRRLIADQSS